MDGLKWGLKRQPTGGRWPSALGRCSQLHPAVTHLVMRGPDLTGPSAVTRHTTCQHSSQMCRGTQACPARCVKLSPHIRLPPGAHRGYYLTLAFPASVSPEDYRLGSSTVLLQLQLWGSLEPTARQRRCFLKDSVKIFTSPVAVVASRWRGVLLGSSICSPFSHQDPMLAWGGRQIVQH